MIDPHWHWTFWAFDGEVGSQEIKWHVEVTVTGKYTEEEAKIAASMIIQRENYMLRRVYDCTTCGYQDAAAQSLKALVENNK